MLKCPRPRVAHWRSAVSGSLALSSWLCVFKRTGRPWNSFLWHQLKILLPHWSHRVCLVSIKMLLAEMHTKFFCLVTPQARSLSQRAYYYLNLSHVITEHMLTSLASCPFFSLDSCSSRVSNWSLTLIPTLGNLGKRHYLQERLKGLREVGGTCVSAPFSTDKSSGKNDFTLLFSLEFLIVFRD